MIKKNKGTPYRDRWRFYLVVGGILIGFSLLVWRLVFLTVIERSFLQAQGKARTVRTVEIPASRGMIMDRHGKPLAVSSPADSVWVNPQEVNVNQKKWLHACLLLQVDCGQLKKRLEHNKKKEFIYLRRQMKPETAKKIADLKLKGVYLQREYRRFYPHGEVTAHIVGFTDIDENGQEGIELAYDDWLRGIPGKRVVQKDRLGNIVHIENELQNARAGEDILLSIDHRIQYIAYSKLKEAVNFHKATSGTVVILDVQTAEVLAMVNYPSYNPNRGKEASNDGRYRNRAITDVFEPGSTIKTFSVVNILNNGVATADTVIDTNPGWINLNGRLVKEIKHRNYGELTLTQVLQKSSNVGIAKFILQTPPNSLWQLLRNLGFGQTTAIQLPGEVSGSLELPRRWSDFTLSTLSFGYGLSSTALQLASTYTVLATGGVKRPISVLKVVKPAKGERVIKKEIANQVNQMLELVVEGKDGTAKKAQISSYRVMGKTGTAEVVGEKGYDRNRHISFFVGALPASEPKVVAVVVINEPTAGEFYGGSVAAPLFAEILGTASRLLNIVPDKIDNTVNEEEKQHG